MEYRLKSCVPGSERHIMILPNNVTVNSLTPEIRMYRDKSLAPPEEIEIEDQIPTEAGVSIAPFGLSSSKMKSKSFKKKTQVVQLEEEEDIRLRDEESVPWVIEDDEQRAFVGKLEGGQQSNYVFFVNQGNEFRVIPASKWYRFVPKIQYHTLSLEEAESKVTICLIV